jgi:hypothetical protein
MITDTMAGRMAELKRQLFEFEDRVRDLEGAAAAILDATEAPNGNGSNGPHWIAGKLVDIADAIRGDFKDMLNLVRDGQEGGAA